MKAKFIGTILTALSFMVLSGPVGAQGVQLLLEDDQLLKNGRKALHDGNLERALFYYEKAINRKGLSKMEMITIHSDLCVTYMYLERFDDAIVQCEASLALRPNRWETVNNLGTVYLVRGDFKEAIAVFERGLKMKSKSRVLQFNLELAKKRAQEEQIRLEIETEKNGQPGREREPSTAG